ncbi:hypothetical protein, partial [Thiolapillus sp.]
LKETQPKTGIFVIWPSSRKIPGMDSQTKTLIQLNAPQLLYLWRLAWLCQIAAYVQQQSTKPTTIEPKPLQEKKSPEQECIKEKPYVTVCCIKKKWSSVRRCTSSVPIFANGALSGSFGYLYNFWSQRLAGNYSPPNVNVDAETIKDIAGYTPIVDNAISAYDTIIAGIDGDWEGVAWGVAGTLGGGWLKGAKFAARGLGKIDPNKLNHVFGQEKHRLGQLLDKFGGNQEKAYRALDDAAQQALMSGKLNIKNGINTQTRVNVNGVEVDLVGGRVVNGRFQIGSASRRDIP